MNGRNIRSICGWLSTVTLRCHELSLDAFLRCSNTSQTNQHTRRHFQLLTYVCECESCEDWNLKWGEVAQHTKNIQNWKKLQHFGMRALFFSLPPISSFSFFLLSSILLWLFHEWKKRQQKCIFERKKEKNELIFIQCERGSTNPTNTECSGALRSGNIGAIFLSFIWLFFACRCCCCLDGNFNFSPGFARS